MVVVVWPHPSFVVVVVAVDDEAPRRASVVEFLRSLRTRAAFTVGFGSDGGVDAAGAFDDDDAGRFASCQPSAVGGAASSVDQSIVAGAELQLPLVSGIRLMIFRNVQVR